MLASQAERSNPPPAPTHQLQHLPICRIIPSSCLRSTSRHPLWPIVFFFSALGNGQAAISGILRNLHALFPFPAHITLAVDTCSLGLCFCAASSEQGVSCGSSNTSSFPLCHLSQWVVITRGSALESLHPTPVILPIQHSPPGTTRPLPPCVLWMQPHRKVCATPRPSAP